MQAEWESHEATWLGWPHNASDWPGKLAAIYWVYGEIVRKLADGERVRILVHSRTHEDRARSVLTRAGANLSSIEFFQIVTDRAWISRLRSDFRDAGSAGFGSGYRTFPIYRLGTLLRLEKR